MAKQQEFTAEISAGHEELLEGSQVAWVRTITVKDSQGKVLRTLKAADNDEDVREKLTRAGYPITEWAGGTSTATVNPTSSAAVRGCLGCLGLIVLGVALIIAYFIFNPGSDEPDETDAKIACHQLVEQKLRAPSTADYSNETVTGSGDSWTARGVVEAENAFGGTVASDYTCSVTFTKGNDEFRGSANITQR